MSDQGHYVSEAEQIAVLRRERDKARSQLETAVGALRAIAAQDVDWSVGISENVNRLQAMAEHALATIQQPQGGR